MSRASCLVRLFRRRGAAARPYGVRAASVQLDRRRCAAGETLTGTICGVAGEHTTVALARFELRPRIAREFVVAEAVASSDDGSYSLSVPPEALPTVTGAHCGLRYAVVPRCAQRPTRLAEVRVFNTGRTHLQPACSSADRLLADWDARNFHIELFTAQLQGGGRIAGRVHRHGSWPPGTISVSACCLECWRYMHVSERGSPQWREFSLWQAEQPLQIDPDAGWAMFSFRLPDHLPPAVEARTIAWRYELRARRSVRHWFDETAALTPLLHEDVALPA